MSLWLNEEMQLSVPSTMSASAVDAAHHELLGEGFACSGDAILLRGYMSNRLRTAPTSDAWGLEWWVNSIHLRSSRPPKDPSWREEVVSHGLALIDGLLPQMARLASGRPVQALLSLQSSPVSVDPEADFASGALHFTLLRNTADDARLVQGRSSQPVMVVTIDPADSTNGGVHA